jgi:hypothetical protein
MLPPSIRYMPTPEPDPEPGLIPSLLREINDLVAAHARGDYCKNILGITARPSSQDPIVKPVTFSVRGAIERVCQLHGYNSRVIHAMFPKDTEVISDIGPRAAKALVTNVIARLSEAS